MPLQPEDLNQQPGLALYGLWKLRSNLDVHLMAWQSIHLDTLSE